METVSFIAVLDGIARRCGIDPKTALNAVQAEELTDYLNTAFRRGWEQEWWPDWTVTQACVLSPPSGGWPFDLPEGECEPCPGPAASGPYIDLDTAGAAPMGTIQSVWLIDPQGRTHEKPFLDFQLSQRGIELPAAIIARAVSGRCQYGGVPTLWVTFRLRPPEFTSEEWASGQVYQPGQLVLRGGECWAANTSTSADPLGSIGAGNTEPDWAVQAFPKLLQRFVVGQASAEALAMMDRPAASQAQSSKASEALEEELTRRGIQQGQTRRYRVRVR